MAKTAILELPHPHEHALGISAAKCLNQFDDYLLRVKGVAPSTRKVYCFWVRRFLAASCGSVSRDPDDDHVLACAIAAKAELIVSGDKRDLLVLIEYQGIPIRNASEALSILASASRPQN